jgi:hypothetical protein
MPTQAQMIKIGTALAILYGVYKFVPGTAAKAAALGVAGVVIAKQLPILKDSLA